MGNANVRRLRGARIQDLNIERRAISFVVIEKSVKSSNYGKFEQAIVSSLDSNFKRNMPVFRNSGNEIKASWKLVAQGRAPLFTLKNAGVLEPFAFFSMTFFGKICQILPRCKRLFCEDPHQRYRKLTHVIQILQILPIMPKKETKDLFKNLTASHKKLFVRPMWYGVFLTALIQEIEIFLGDKFTPEFNYAWVSICSLVNKELLHAAFIDLALIPSEVHSFSPYRMPKLKHKHCPKRVGGIAH